MTISWNASFTLFSSWDRGANIGNVHLHDRTIEQHNIDSRVSGTSIRMTDTPVM